MLSFLIGLRVRAFDFRPSKENVLAFFILPVYVQDARGLVGECINWYVDLGLT